MILPKKQPPAEWQEDLDEETEQLADMYEAIPSDTDWLDGIQDDGLPPIRAHEISAEISDPFAWLRQLLVGQQADLVGPHAALWRTHDSWRRKVARLDAELQSQISAERERDVRQWLKDDRQALSALEESPQFQAALLHLLSRVGPILDRIETEGGDDPDQGNFRERARQRRHELEALLMPTTQSSAQRSSTEKEEQTEGSATPITWQEIARAIADELDSNDAKAGAWGGLKDIANRVSTEMRKRDIKGSRGPVSGNTVLREALQGNRWRRKR